jgi:hypothetical protein
MCSSYTCDILIFKRQTSTKLPKIVIYKWKQHYAHITVQKLLYRLDTSNMVRWLSPPSSEKSNSASKNTAIDSSLYCHAQ